MPTYTLPNNSTVFVLGGGTYLRYTLPNNNAVSVLPLDVIYGTLDRLDSYTLDDLDNFVIDDLGNL
ncbi:MAG: hypothetical protein NUW01_07245 [Gemmatimonadaceae bacterium]|nr:hypothetical protein [Gemmatimonadaceae bacterium]